MGQFCNRAYCRQFHLFVDGGCANVQRATEDKREAKDVVHLVRVIRPTSRYHCRSGFFRLFGIDLRSRIRTREDDRILRHRPDHIRGQRTRSRDPDKSVRTCDHFRQSPLLFHMVGNLRHLLFHRVQSLSSLINGSLPVCHDHILKPHGDKQADDRDPCRPGS